MTGETTEEMKSEKLTLTKLYYEHGGTWKLNKTGFKRCVSVNGVRREWNYLKNYRWQLHSGYRQKH